ncbi:hypothetical protein JTE90_007562 [Oedothorax gibbosus]|uniref:Uncharacterized protein n=1 Tax=Oedothorax gibbosus TaxID=931172 RepID=A0AAV6TRG1_9ARAC|nr:hypothetical protein JTE90_007562 [Oedothorax gibbosus]
MTDSAEAITLRGREKATITRIATYVEKIGGIVTEADYEELTIRLERLDEVFKNFNNYDSELPDEAS